MLIDKKIPACILALAIFFSCTKQKGFGTKSDAVASTAVLVQNATDYRPDPTVTTSLSGGGNIQIVLSIPSGSKRTIKEITKVATSTSYSKIQSASTTGFYIKDPIPGNGTSVTFITTLAEYFTRNPVSTSNPAAKADTELALRFYFLITLDDNTVLVARPVRILVLA